MEKVLSQAEIDALFAQVTTDPPAESPASSTPQELELYNFARGGQISNEQMKAISTVNDLFARNLVHTFGAWLRTEFSAVLVSGEQLPFSEFLGRVADPTFLCSLRLEPIGAVGLLEMDLALSPSIVDLLLGGTGKAEEVRELTDIEELIMASVAQMISRELTLAWQDVGLQFHFEKREAASQSTRLIPPGEKTLCMCFEIRMPEARGMLNLCMPSTVLNTILRPLVAEPGRNRRRSHEVGLRMRELLNEATVGSVLQFAPIQLRATELAGLAPGSVLRLPIPRHLPAELRVAGMVYGKARPVRIGEHRGAQLQAHTQEGSTETTAAVN